MFVVCLVNANAGQFLIGIGYSDPQCDGNQLPECDRSFSAVLGGINFKTMSVTKQAFSEQLGNCDIRTKGAACEGLDINFVCPANMVIVGVKSTLPNSNKDVRVFQFQCGALEGPSTPPAPIHALCPVLRRVCVQIPAVLGM